MANKNNIYKDSNMELSNNISGYFEDLKIYLHSYAYSMTLIDIENALKTGKTCNRFSNWSKNWSDAKRR